MNYLGGYGRPGWSKSWETEETDDPDEQPAVQKVVPLPPEPVSWWIKLIAHVILLAILAGSIWLGAWVFHRFMPAPLP